MNPEKLPQTPARKAEVQPAPEKRAELEKRREQLEREGERQALEQKHQAETA